jgi:hypothetical protein
MIAARMQIATVTSQEILLSGTPLFWRAVSGPALTPELALDYLDELSVDIEAAVVLDSAGKVAAATPPEGPARDRVGELAAKLLDQVASADGGGSDQVEIALPEGSVYAVRGEHWSVAVITRRQALPSLMFYDLRHVIEDLGS